MCASRTFTAVGRKGGRRSSRCGGIKDSPPYFHDGLLPTLKDTVEFFDLILELKLASDENQDLVAFLRAL